MEVVDQQSAAPSITQIPTKKGKGEENYLQVLIASCQFHRKLRDTLMRYLTMLIEHGVKHGESTNRSFVD